MDTLGHSHRHERRSVPADRHTRWLLGGLLAPFVVATLVGLVALWPDDATPPVPNFIGPPAELADGTVTRLVRGPCEGTEESRQVRCQAVSLRLTSGPEAGRTVRFELSIGAGSPTLSEGDEIVAGRVADPAGGSNAETDGGNDSWYFSDFQRRTPLLLLGAGFALAVVVLARWRGLLALVGLGVSLVVLVRFILPAILEGSSPVAVSVVGAAVIMFVTLYLAHGLNVCTTTAVLGTLGALVLTGTLAWAFVEVAHLTGLSSEEAGFLQAAAGQVNLEGLLLGGIVIGSLGVLDDVTVTQASATWELHRANPSLGFGGLFSAGLRIGRDHIASTVNTLVLAYAGASLPLLVLFTLANRDLSSVLTGELVAQEIVRTLVGSIGLVAAVPFTTALGAFVLHRHGTHAHLEKPDVNVSLSRHQHP
ncbi:MAG: YibE/F family protein [Acidimicrobiia bacterium]